MTVVDQLQVVWYCSITFFIHDVAVEHNPCTVVILSIVLPNKLCRLLVSPCSLSWLCPIVISIRMQMFHCYTNTQLVPECIFVIRVLTRVFRLTVSVEATSDYFEGLFMMARVQSDFTAAYGTFMVDNTEWFKTLDCYNQSGVGYDTNATELYYIGYY